MNQFKGSKISCALPSFLVLLILFFVKIIDNFYVERKNEG